jgi:hypothetical protein
MARRKGKNTLMQFNSKSGRKVRKNAKITMPLRMFRRALSAMKTGKRAKIKARVH